MAYTAQNVREAVESQQDRLFAPWAIGRPDTWVCDPRTKSLICIGYWLTEELSRIGTNDADRRTQELYYNRWSRSEDDLWELVARTLNTVLEGKVEQGRVPHRRWG